MVPRAADGDGRRAHCIQPLSDERAELIGQHSVRIERQVRAMLLHGTERHDDRGAAGSNLGVHLGRRHGREQEAVGAASVTVAVPSTRRRP